MNTTQPLGKVKSSLFTQVQQFVSNHRTKLSTGAGLGLILLSLHQTFVAGAAGVAVGGPLQHASGKIMKWLGALGVEHAGSKVTEFLAKYSRPGAPAPTLEQAIAAVQDMHNEERQWLDDLGEKIDFWPMLLKEAFQQQRMDLVGDFRTVLDEWGENLVIPTLQALLIEVEQQTQSIQKINQHLETHSQAVQKTSEDVQAQTKKLQDMQEESEVLLGLVHSIEQQLNQREKSSRELRGEIIAMRVELTQMSRMLEKIMNQLAPAPVVTLPRRKGRRRWARIYSEKMLESVYRELDDESDMLL